MLYNLGCKLWGDLVQVQVVFVFVVEGCHHILNCGLGLIGILLVCKLCLLVACHALWPAESVDFGRGCLQFVVLSAWQGLCSLNDGL